MGLATRNVFIDTEWYVRSGLDFSSKTIKSFVDICSAGQISHITTSIVAKEVEGKIVDHVKDTVDGITKLQRKVRSVSGVEGLPLAGYLVKIDEAELRDKAVGLFRNFLLRSEATLLGLDKVNSNAVFNDYFNQQPPFGAGKKKSEFPDAFNMACLSSFVGADAGLYVISQDQDLISYCEKNSRYILVSSLEKFLDIYYEHMDTVSVAIKAHALIEAPSIKQLVKGSLEAEGAFNGAAWEDSEVQDFVVTKVELSEPSVVSLFEDSCTLTFEANVEYSVSVSGPDYSNGLYDREDDVIHTFGNTVRQDYGEASFEVEVDAYYMALESGIVFHNIEVTLGVHGPLEVYVEETATDYD
ncbi:hypothetical protein BW686_01945 [Pseudomonas syringae]|uniref:DUF4935 domain-containing protein n=1 Tax=Pseudomonas syringae TaxID=317 RepID=A0A244EWH5_PSESX|nr:PIN domain-containing protein [Pseudomonas syringae]OUM08758.1 hypothetical protein BW686_01945 [Pseudomonas syringae]